MEKANRKVVFVHDGPFRYDVNGELIVTNNTLLLKKRYEYLGDELTFMLRAIQTDVVNTENMDVKLNFVRVPAYNRLHLLKNYFKACRIVESTIKNTNVAVIRLPSTIGSLAVKYAKKYHKPYIIEVVGCPQDTLKNYSLTGKLYAPFAKLKLKFKVLNAPYVIYVSSFFLQKRYPTRGNQTSISNVIMNTNENIVANKIESYKTLNTKSEISLSTLGAIDISYKGHEFVIRAIAKLKTQNYNIHYYIAGLGSKIRLLSIAQKLGVENQIHFEGLLNRNEIFSLLDNTDIYIQPSLTEGLPRSVVEAMSRGCICIGTNVGGIPELIQPNLLFDKKSVSQIVTLIKEIVNHTSPELISERNFQLAKLYNNEILERKRIDFYNMFLKQNDL